MRLCLQRRKTSVFLVVPYGLLRTRGFRARFQLLGWQDLQLVTWHMEVVHKLFRSVFWRGWQGSSFFGWLCRPLGLLLHACAALEESGSVCEVTPGWSYTFAAPWEFIPGWKCSSFSRILPNFSRVTVSSVIFCVYWLIPFLLAYDSNKEFVIAKTIIGRRLSNKVMPFNVM